MRLPQRAVPRIEARTGSCSSSSTELATPTEARASVAAASLASFSSRSPNPASSASSVLPAPQRPDQPRRGPTGTRAPTRPHPHTRRSQPAFSTSTVNPAAELRTFRRCECGLGDDRGPLGELPVVCVWGVRSSGGWAVDPPTSRWPRHGIRCVGCSTGLWPRRRRDGCGLRWKSRWRRGDGSLLRPR